MADSLQDLIRSRLFPNQSQEKSVDFNSKIDLFIEYLKTVDIHLVERNMGFKPAKSIEFGKTDQSMLNHIRNGILFLFRFNKALEKLQARPLDEVGLRNGIALFVVHELHKLEFKEFLDEEDLPERMDSIAVSLNCILLIFLIIKFIIQFKITIYMLISILYKMNALLISATIPSGEDARTVSPKIRLIDEKKPSTAHRLPY